MSTLIATRGLPASGKTSYALRLLARARPGSMVRLNRDDIRWMAHGGVLLRNRTELQVSAIQQPAAEALLRSGADVVVDDTNLRSATLRRWAELAAGVGAGFEVADFTDVDVAECVARDRHREDPQRRVGEAAIRDMHRRYLLGRTLPLPVPSIAPLTPEPATPPPAAPPAVLCDVDAALGTAGDDGRAVVAALGAAAATGDRVLLLSGRTEARRGETEAWLATVGIRYDALYLRRTGDSRRDARVKLALFDEHVREHYRIRYVLTGPGTAQPWRSLTLTAFRVCAAQP